MTSSYEAIAAPKGRAGDKAWGGDRIRTRKPFPTGGNRRLQERRRRLVFGIAADWAGHVRPPDTTRLTSLADARIRDAKPLEPPGRSKTTRSALSPTRIAPERSGSARRRPRRAISKIARAVAPPFIRATRYANSISRNMEGTLIIALSVPSRS